MPLRYELLTSEKWKRLDLSQRKALASSFTTFSHSFSPRLRGETIQGYIKRLRSESIISVQFETGMNMAICWDGARIVGVSGFGSKTNGVVERLFTGTLPAYERMGIGTRLSLMVNGYARRQHAKVKIHFMSPEGRGLGVKLLNRAPRFIYRKGKKVGIAETYEVMPRDGELDVTVHTNQPLPATPTTKGWWKKTKIGIHRLLRRKKRH